MDDEVSAHRTRTNRLDKPEPLPAPKTLVVAVDAIFQPPIEDRN